MSGLNPPPTDRRALLAGLGGLAAGTFLSASRAEAGSLTPPAAPAPTGKPLTEVEPRIAINDTNTPGNAGNLFRITKPGSYYLTGNITGESGKNGILITASNVTIDLMGFAMLGVAGSLRGIATSGACDDLIIRNGTIRGWGSDGINLPLSGFGYNALIEGVISAANGRMGIRVGNHAVVRGCLVEGNTQAGISCNTNCTIEQCSARNVTDFGIITSEGCRVANCSVWGGTGTGISVPGQCLVEHNQIHGCQAGGILVAAGSGTVVQDNTVRATGNFGLWADTGGHTFRNNSVRGCKDNYVFAAGNNLELLISQIPQTLKWPCVARLEGTLQGVANQGGIVINSDNVTIDLAGHSLVGVPNSTNGIATQGTRNNLAVRNGAVTNWGEAGVDLRAGGEGDVSILESLMASSARGPGIVGNHQSVIRNCVAKDCGRSGIFALNDSIVENCTAVGNGKIGDLSLRGIFVGYRSLVSKCTVSRTRGVGIYVRSYSIVDSCISDNNTENGIEAEGSTIIRDNSCVVNGSEDPSCAGIRVSSMGNRIQGNCCTFNSKGLHIGSSYNIIYNNTCKSNEINYDISANNKVGVIVSAPNSGAISGSTGGAGLGTTDPWANFSF